jgi:hypothetical protein
MWIRAEVHALDNQPTTARFRAVHAAPKDFISTGSERWERKWDRNA